MTTTTERDALEWLRESANSGEVHTVRLCWSDRLGTMRGKRLPANVFLDSPKRRISFCDGMIVVDVNCNVIQETPFSNFDTGYPDMYLAPRLETIRKVGWADGEALVLGVLESHSGEPLAVSPANSFARVWSRLERSGVAVETRVTICGRLMRDKGESFRLLPDGLGATEDGPGIMRLALDGLRRSDIAVRSLETDREGGFRLGLDWMAPHTAAEQAVMVKAAMKELARERGIDAVFMTLLPGAPGPSRLQTELRVSGVEINDDDLSNRLREIRPALQPSINAFKSGPTELVTRGGGDKTVLELDVSSEADPSTALMAVCAAIGSAQEGAASKSVPEPLGLYEAALLLDRSIWARDWLGDELVNNMVPLLKHEAELFNASVTDWELNRYWSPA